MRLSFRMGWHRLRLGPIGTLEMDLDKVESIKMRANFNLGWGLEITGKEKKKVFSWETLLVCRRGLVDNFSCPRVDQEWNRHEFSKRVKIVNLVFFPARDRPG